ncbi:MAG: hypothetical protein E7616_04880 [Ruminococcaceae bacterium]|nr:hypothetical protein [Oscillospiraceae bacterium]
MTLSKELDLAIKLSEIKTIEGGYLIGGKEYNTYMTNEEWEKFKTDMLPSAHEEYSAGGGDELSDKNGRPPKMACYGSSSRLIYKLSCHKECFHYEKKLSTTVGGTANLDGFMEEDHRYVFVEAKCHEPYSAKKNSVSHSYANLYNYINEQMLGSIEIKMQPKKCKRYMDVEYFAEGEQLAHFDMKQMICHLLGIATGVLKGELELKQIDFIYLLYDPTELDLSPDTKAAVDSIYERTCYECNLIDFATLLRVIFAFLKEEKYGELISDEDLDALVCKFTFSLASQDFYPILLQ